MKKIALIIVTLIIACIIYFYNKKVPLIGKWNRIALYAEQGIVELDDTMTYEFISKDQLVMIYNNKLDTLNYTLERKTLEIDSTVLLFSGKGIEPYTTLSIVESDTLVMMSLSPMNNYEPYVMQVFVKIED